MNLPPWTIPFNPTINGDGYTPGEGLVVTVHPSGYVTDNTPLLLLALAVAAYFVIKA